MKLKNKKNSRIEITQIKKPETIYRYSTNHTIKGIFFYIEPTHIVTFYKNPHRFLVKKRFVSLRGTSGFSTSFNQLLYEKKCLYITCYKPIYYNPQTLYIILTIQLSFHICVSPLLHILNAYTNNSY